MFNSKLGFHQFYNDSKIKNNITATQANFLLEYSLSKSQFISGLITSYLVDMGINPNIMKAINSSDKNMNYFSRKKLVKFNVLNDKGYSRWKMYPYRGTLMIYSLNNASSYAYNLTEKISISCSPYNNNRPTIILDVYKSKKMSNITNITPYNIISGKIILDNIEFDLDKDHVKITYPTDAIYISLEKEMINKLLIANSIEVSLLIPRAHGGWYTPKININNDENKMIELSLSKCR